MQADDDDDMEVGTVEMNKDNQFKCPITGELLVNPVRKWSFFLSLMTSKECQAHIQQGRHHEVPREEALRHLSRRGLRKEGHGGLSRARR